MANILLFAMMNHASAPMTPRIQILQHEAAYPAPEVALCFPSSPLPSYELHFA
jgi:hypothetical protein